MKAFVTGGAGFIGSNLVDALVARGERLVAAPDAAVAADHEVGPSPVFEQLDGVRQRPRRQRDLVAGRLEPLDERPQDDHVCRVGEVDPDAHGGHV